MDELEQHESPITSELPEVRIHLDPASVLEEPPEPEDGKLAIP